VVEREIRADAVAILLEQVARMIHGAGHAEGLYPAQWVALRYFAEADAPARTVAGLARYQGLSIAPVARTVRTLVEKGLLARRPGSGRADLVEVSESGHGLLKLDPRQVLVQALAQLDTADRRPLAEALERVARALAARGLGDHG